jgi:hypothetical protein
MLDFIQTGWSGAVAKAALGLGRVKTPEPTERVEESPQTFAS